MRKNDIYVCDVCGAAFEVLRAGDGEVACCGVPATLQTANTVDAAVEKHLPEVARTGDGRATVVVGEVAHPMKPEHYIEWIEIVQDGRTRRADLRPGDAPTARFEIDDGPATVRAFCNLHGLWAREIPAASWWRTANDEESVNGDESENDEESVNGEELVNGEESENAVELASGDDSALRVEEEVVCGV